MARQSSDISNKDSLLQVLDRVLETGVPTEIKRKGKRLLITPVKNKGKLAGLEPHPDFIVGDADDLVEMDWSQGWKPNI